MKGIDRTGESYSFIPKLFRTIENLNEDQQLALLKQLCKGRLNVMLFNVIVEMSEVQQLNLLKQIENLPVYDLPIRTVSLDEDQSSMREHMRKSCSLDVVFKTDGQKYKDVILNISTVGVFIETNTTLSVGQEMSLTFNLPNYEYPLTLEGSVAWIGSNGIGIQFTDLSGYQEEIIRAYIEKEGPK
jgi:Tfp pilus assembly protein PilZ